MPRKSRKFNKSNNFFAFIGRPIFKAVVYFVAFIGFFLLKLSQVSLPSLPKFSSPKINFRIPKLRFFVFALTIIILFGTFYFEILYQLPDPHDLTKYPNKLTTQILDRNGKLLYKIYKDENRTLVRLNDLPEFVKQAFLSAEDKDFYQHKGFSPYGILRAFYRNIFSNHTEGGSTITQQLVKNTLLSSEKTITRKLKEIVLAVEVESIFDKDQIFEMYLNQVSFGGPAYGIQEASRQYFNLNAKDLDLAQAAFLAGLPQAPSKYSPFGNNPELAHTRQQIILLQMHKLGYIDENQLTKSLNEKLEFQSAKIEIKAPHFVMYVKDLLISQLGDQTVNNGGLIITTTLDLDLQDLAQDTVSREIAKLGPYRVSNGAALVTNPQNGEILAMVGSKDYFNLAEDGQVNITTSLRQPGSSIKPLNYALAFEKGLTPSTVIEDKPIAITNPSQASWIPKNYDGRFHGFVSLRQALGSSYNIPSVLLLSQNGINEFALLAKRMGISTWTDPSRFGLSMALGSLEVKMVDLVTAYSSFANKGISTPLKAILKVEKQSGNKIYLTSCPNQILANPDTATVNASETNCSPKQNISEDTAYLITDILSDNQARSPAFGPNSVLNIKKTKVAVKTGTSNELKDNWAIGYTKDFLVATWVGNNNSTPMSNIASGITGASPIWANIMNQIIEKNPNQITIEPPKNLRKIAVCSITGTLPCDGCPTRYEYFEIGKEPTTKCNPEDIKKWLNPTNPF